VTDPIADAADALLRGGLVVFPTDTVYGLAARPDDPDATGRLFLVKHRPEGLTIPVLVGSMEDARRVGVFDGSAERLAMAWPGAVTLVLPRTRESHGWSLGGDGETVGVRIPKHQLALALLTRTGPLAVTSANRSGEPPLEDAASLAAGFGDDVAVYLCEEAPLSGAASTVVGCLGGDPVIIRAGAVSDSDIARFLAGEGPLLDSRPSP
jgi:tRNA threonylcarbamoyl adenosine modification protein (Sua5/YciO/YrdC/YwlC family)